MRLEYLEEFLVLAETVNYSEAADKMFISTSALSRHIVLLEKALGETLFNREARAVTLTDAGVRLIPFAQKMLATKKEYMDAMARERLTVHQNLRLGFTASIVAYGIMDLLIEFRQKNPDISVLLEEHNNDTLMQLAKNNDCNFVLCYQYEFPESGDLQSIELVRDTLAVAFPATHPLAESSYVTLQQLAGDPQILHKKGGASYRHITQLFREAGVTPQISTHAESGEHIIKLVSLGIGISIVEKIRCQHSCPHNVKIVDLEPSFEKSVSICFKSRQLTAAENRFLMFFRDKLKLNNSGQAGQNN